MQALPAKGTPLRAIADAITANGMPISFAGVKKVLDPAQSAAPDKPGRKASRR
jgi:hypothetical protein